MRKFFTAAMTAFAFGAAALPPVAAQERPSTILVLDASGSMWGQIDGVNKITIAREVVAGILADFPADQPLGFVTYGHRERGQCSDIQTVIEPAAGTAPEIVKIVNELNPRGMTPMTDAVIAAAQSLRHTEQAATVILVSDGIETCNPDPCAAARALEQSGIDFTAHVIGFDVKGEAEALMQMQCIANETGGRFLTADTADELSAALTQVVAQEPDEPEPAELTLIAVMDSESGPQVETPVSWKLELGEDRLEVDGNPSSVELRPGYWSVTGYHVALEQEVSADLAIVEGNDRTYTMVFETPKPTARLVAPETAVAGSMIEVGWNGPDDQNDNIQIAHIGGSYLHYTYTNQGNPVRLQIPAAPGQYELRYSHRDQEVIHRQPITVTPAELGIIAPDKAAAGSVIEVGWVGPNAQNDNIQIAEIGGTYRYYAYTNTGNPVKLQMPAEAGDYELRYSFRDTETIHTRPITVTSVEVDLIAPETAIAGSEIEVGWAGPNAQNDNIQIAEIGGSYVNYTYTHRGNPLKLQMPIKPGDYELRYSFRDESTIFTRPITVTPAKIDLVAPVTAVAGSEIEIGWTGPNAPSDNIQIAPVGGSYLAYTYTRQGNPLKLRMPDRPGDYELRYSFRDLEVVLRRPITVTAK